MNIPINEENDLDIFYWIPKLHNNPYLKKGMLLFVQQMNCLQYDKKMLSTVKEGLYNHTVLLDNLNSRSFSKISSIPTFDISTHYTIIPRAN